MWFTKNEKRVLQLLLENSRLTDTNIAFQLNISSQAVGRIRKEFEEESIVQKYSIEVDLDKIGIKVCALIKFKIPEEQNTKEIEEELKKLDNLIGLIKTMHNHSGYFMNIAFRTIEELEEFANNNKLIKKLIILEILPFPKKNILKLSMANLVKWALNNSGTKKTNFEL